MVLLYQPSYFFIEGNEARSATQTALMEDLNTMLQPIYQASDRLDKMGGSPQVQVSREAPVGTGFEAPAGTIFAEHDAGITAGVFIVYGANSEKLGNTSSLFGPRN
jgi:hypothetical protein